jgi:dethiobiotin synthetase
MPVPPLPNRAPPAGTTSEGTVVVCGSDTGVGKTFVTTQLVRALAARGERVAVHKPIE